MKNIRLLASSTPSVFTPSMDGYVLPAAGRLAAESGIGPTPGWSGVRILALRH
jgi:hypothetical protein